MYVPQLRFTIEGDGGTQFTGMIHLFRSIVHPYIARSYFLNCKDVRTPPSISIQRSIICPSLIGGTVCCSLASACHYLTTGTQRTADGLHFYRSEH